MEAVQVQGETRIIMINTRVLHTKICIGKFKKGEIELTQVLHIPGDLFFI